jgi:hypothetical protein
MPIENFENNIFGMIPAEAWLQVGFDVYRPDDPIDQLFGDVKTENIVAYWESMAAEYGIPVMAQFHAFDTESQKTMRAPIDVHNIEKGLIKVKIDQSERLRALMGRGVNRQSALIERVLNDGYNLAEQVFTRTKVAKNEVMATGKMTINENNLSLTVDYGVPAANLNKVIDVGAGASTPLDEQILELTQASRSAGAPINGMYCGQAALNKLRKNGVLQMAINGANMVGQLVRMSDLRAYLAEEHGITRILVNDATYSLPLTEGNNGRPVVSAQRYFPANKISFFHANGKIGDGLWGDPPEVSASRFMEVSESAVSPYVYVSQYAEEDPAVTWTKASALFMPVLYNPNALYVASITETAAANG